MHNDDLHVECLMYIAGQQTTALVELWPRLYELVQDLERELDSRTEKRNMRDAVMLERIKNSLRPDRMMVFLLELHREGMHFGLTSSSWHLTLCIHAAVYDLRLHL